MTLLKEGDSSLKSIDPVDLLNYIHTLFEEGDCVVQHLIESFREQNIIFDMQSAAAQ